MKDWCDQSGKTTVDKNKCDVCDGLGVIKSPSDLYIDPETDSDLIFDDHTGIMWRVCLACQRDTQWIKDGTKPPRGSWDDIWMSLAVDIASRSTCNIPMRNIGCVIVSEDNTKVLSLGYNGSAKGDDNGCEYTGDDSPVIGSSRCTCVHAEMNALTKLDTSSPIGKIMYVTTSPCMLCYKLIVNAGIKEVVYMWEYSRIPLDKLEELGVKVRMYV